VWKRYDIEIDPVLVDEAIRRFRVADAREAVHLALRTLLHDDDEDEYDEFSDPSAWQRRTAGGGG
jgi:Arc/MetJ family transcription regulator